MTLDNLERSALLQKKTFYFYEAHEKKLPHIISGKMWADDSSF